MELRYVFSEVGGRIVKSDSLPLDADIPAQGTIVFHPLIRPPTRRGHYRLSFDLVQRIEGTLVPLPILPVELSYDVPGGLR